MTENHHAKTSKDNCSQLATVPSGQKQDRTAARIIDVVIDSQILHLGTTLMLMGKHFDYCDFNT